MLEDVQRLGQWLVAAQLVTEPQLAEAQVHQQQSGASLGALLVEHGMVDEQQLVSLLSARLRLPEAPSKLYRRSIPNKILGLVPQDICWQLRLIPFGVDPHSGRVQVAMADPTDPDALGMVRRLAGRDPAVHIIGPRQIEKAIRKHYLDSLVEETNASRRRFFGYEGITDPGLVGSVRRARSRLGRGRGSEPGERPAPVPPVAPLAPSNAGPRAPIGRILREQPSPQPEPALESSTTLQRVPAPAPEPPPTQAPAAELSPAELAARLERLELLLAEVVAMLVPRLGEEARPLLRRIHAELKPRRGDPQR